MATPHRRVTTVVASLLLATVGAATPATGMPAEPARPAVAQPRSSAAQPFGVRGGWRLVFRDEFRGTRLDLDKWRPNWLAGSDRVITKPVNSAELAAYDPRQVRVAKGSLRLRAVRRDTTDNRGRSYRYASGLVESFHDYQFSYGYAEARIFLKANTDPSLGDVGSCGPNWPAFWLNGKDHPEDGEIDVMECLSEDDVAWHYHWGEGSNGGYPDRWSGRMPGGGGWHTFGVNWERDRLTFYYDGRKVGTQRAGVTGSPHYLILNNGLSGTAIKTPSTLKVDYVRVWKPTR
ncbi:glycoside hydrolase family 16 protein [Nocardioides xinjiangensis]|uniref:glycoside hydrolase family 16 protein n=1 Tax=Nocardioides xinjiangensis TaxID=2817376 RepID=UPI001B31366C|nr:glycoside hydrolase family 16 protein [Nocardioides sp. SYSU D00778]